MKILIAVLTSIIFSSCSNHKPYEQETTRNSHLTVSKKNQTYVFTCSDDFHFIVNIEGKTAWLFLPDQTVQLTQTTTDSKSLYKGNSFLLKIHEQVAELQSAKRHYQNCRNNAAKAVWEHAKLNGIDFRAIGNEPGWSLDITKAGNIWFISNYGQSHYQFKTPEPIIYRQAHITKYTVHNEAHKLEVILKSKSCSDDMSGEIFETTVTVILDDHRYRGCGMTLH